MGQININIKELRIKLRLGQQQLADLIGVQRPYISRWETGSVVPSEHYQDKLCEVFGVNKVELLGYEIKDNALENAIEGLRKLPQRHQLRVISYINDLTAEHEFFANKRDRRTSGM